jgi:cell filamentation protein
MKYELPKNQDEILPNLLNLSTIEDIGLSEFEGFLKAEIFLTEKLTSSTKFNLEYVLNIHQIALRHLYSFAGRLRTVNMSKGGFAFPAARYLSNSMNEFNANVLSRLPDNYNNDEKLIRDIAVVHGELLFIHPFREGNGRTARILANLMARKQGFDALEFGKIKEAQHAIYISAF